MERINANNKGEENVVSVLVVLAGVFATDSPLFSKYYYMLLITLLGLLGIIRVNRSGSPIINRVGKNKHLVYLGLYMLFIVFCWHLVSFILNRDVDHIVSGLGNVIYVLGAALFFSLYSNKCIRLFCGAYVFTFCCLFLSTGNWTLYDIGNVSRTVGVYLNANYLAFFALGSGCFSLVFYRGSKKISKILYVFSIGLVVAAIINSGSRAMYIGVTAALVLLLTVMLFSLAYKRTVSSRRLRLFFISLTAILAVVLIVGSIFMPRMENAVIDNVHGLDRTNQSVWSLFSPVQDVANKASTTGERYGETAASGIERVLNGAYTEAGAFSTNRRLAIWERYFERFNEYWLFGSSPSKDGFYFPEYSRIYVTHNTFLNMLFKYGIFGLLLYLSVLWNCFFPVSKVRHLSSRYICVLFLVSFCVFSCFHDIVDYPLFWCVLALTLRVMDRSQSQTELIM